MQLENPFHEGELLVQQQAGEIAKGEQNGRIIADSIPKGAFKFSEQQSMVILGSVDGEQNVWASILLGHPGFIRAVDSQTVEFDLERVFKHPGDRFWTNIDRENRIGMLVIELATRRRLRINGAIAPITTNKLRLRVLESYPNCPKYIQRRQLSINIATDLNQLPESRSGQILTSEQQTWIKLADTFFVASFYPTRGIDVSHRGGNPGFIQISDRQTLRIPDYIGNGMFNTLGNLAVNPLAGLVFIDFDCSRTLQLIGRANILWDLEESEYPTGGTRRYWNFEIEQWSELNLPITFDCEFLDYSPYNPHKS